MRQAVQASPDCGPLTWYQLQHLAKSHDSPFTDFMVELGSVEPRILRSIFKIVPFASKWPSSTTNIILLNLSFTVLGAHRTGFLKRCCGPFADIILGNGIVSKEDDIFRRNSISSKWHLY